MIVMVPFTARAYTARASNAAPKIIDAEMVEKFAQDVHAFDIGTVEHQIMDAISMVGQMFDQYKCFGTPGAQRQALSIFKTLSEFTQATETLDINKAEEYKVSYIHEGIKRAPTSCGAKFTVDDAMRQGMEFENIAERVKEINFTDVVEKLKGFNNALKDEFCFVNEKDRENMQAVAASLQQQLQGRPLFAIKSEIGERIDALYEWKVCECNVLCQYYAKADENICVKDKEGRAILTCDMTPNDRKEFLEMFNVRFETPITMMQAEKFEKLAGGPWEGKIKEVEDAKEQMAEAARIIEVNEGGCIGMEGEVNQHIAKLYDAMDIAGGRKYDEMITRERVDELVKGLKDLECKAAEVVPPPVQENTDDGADVKVELENLRGMLDAHKLSGCITQELADNYKEQLDALRARGSGELAEDINQLIVDFDEQVCSVMAMIDMLVEADRN